METRFLIELKREQLAFLTSNIPNKTIVIESNVKIIGIKEFIN